MDLLSCATQRLMVVGVKRSGKYTTPYRGAPMSRWGNVTERSQEVFSSPKSQGAYSPTYPQWCSAMRGDLFGEVLRSLCQIFSSKNKNIFWKYLLYFRLCWSWLETCLKWSFLTDRKSSFPTVTAWRSSCQNCRRLQTDFLQDLLRDTTALTHMFVYQIKDETLRISQVLWETSIIKRCRSSVHWKCIFI